MTAHATAFPRLNYHMINCIQVLALKVRVGINSGSKDDCD